MHNEETNVNETTETAPQSEQAVSDPPVEQQSQTETTTGQELEQQEEEYLTAEQEKELYLLLKSRYEPEEKETDPFDPYDGSEEDSDQTQAQLDAMLTLVKPMMQTNIESTLVKLGYEDRVIQNVLKQCGNLTIEEYQTLMKSEAAMLNAAAALQERQLLRKSKQQNPVAPSADRTKEPAGDVAPKLDPNLQKYLEQAGVTLTEDELKQLQTNGK